MTLLLETNKPHVFMCNLNNPVENWLMSVGWEQGPAGSGLAGVLERIGRFFRAPDFDVSLITFDGRHNPVGFIYYDCVVSLDGSISHSCYNNIKPKGRANQALLYYPQRINPQIQSMILTVSGFSGANLKDLDRIYCQLTNRKTGRDFAVLNIEHLSQHPSIAILLLERLNNGWQVTALDHRMKSARLPDMVEELKPVLLMRDPTL